MVGKMEMQDTSKAPIRYGTRLRRYLTSIRSTQVEMRNGHAETDHDDADDVAYFVLYSPCLVCSRSSTKKTGYKVHSEDWMSTRILYRCEPGYPVSALVQIINFSAASTQTWACLGWG